MRFAFVLMALLLPGLASAACGGTDLRAALTDAQRAEISQRSAGAPYAIGNHWTATKPGRTVHVIGTMHIDAPEMAAAAERLAPVIQSADLLLVEATLEDQKDLQRDIATKPDLAFLTGQTLIDLMPADEWDALAAAAQARGIPSFMAAKFQPWYLSLILSMSPCALKEAASGAKGLDHRLMETAQAADVPIQALEDYTTIFRLFGQDPLEDQIRLLSVGILPEQFSEDATATLIAQYFEEQHIAALHTSRVTSRPMVDLPPEEFDVLFDEFIGMLVDQRNRSWIAPIEAAEGEVIVVAAGALHLGGEVGVLNLLAELGYTIERQPF